MTNTNGMIEEDDVYVVETEPTILHKSQGLDIYINPKNKFCIIRLHYTADPRKRSEKWKGEARAGMTPSAWAKEYEIDWTAEFGEKVFPAILSRRNEIVCEPKEFGPDQVYFGGLDWGQRNPTSFHVYTIHDGTIYALWEIYEPAKSIPDMAWKIKSCPYYDRIKYIAADPDLWRNKSHDKRGNPTSIYSLLVEQGIYKLLAGSTDESAWLAMMRTHWPSVGPVGFRISTDCPRMIDEFSGALFADMSDKLMQTKNYHESIVDKNNHAMDDCKYFMLSRPRLQQTSIKLPTMANRWKN